MPRHGNDTVNLPDIAAHTSAALADEDALGPAMRALNARQRAFVDAMYTLGADADYTTCAKAAGYKAESEGSLRVQAHRLAHSPKVQAAISEEADRRAAGLLPLCHKKMEKIILTDGHDQQFAAIKHAQALAGKTPRIQHTVEHKTDRAALMNEITAGLAMLKELGIKVDMGKVLDVTPTSAEVVDRGLLPGGHVENQLKDDERW